MSYMKIMKSCEPKIDPWGTPYRVYAHLERVAGKTTCFQQLDNLKTHEDNHWFLRKQLDSKHLSHTIERIAYINTNSSNFKNIIQYFAENIKYISTSLIDYKISK